jgi:hypothetical protein
VFGTYPFRTSARLSGILASFAISLRIPTKYFGQYLEIPHDHPLLNINLPFITINQPFQTAEEFSTLA